MIEINYRREKLPLDLENVIVEIGFGNGDFLLNMASSNPERFFIGIEISGISIDKLVRKAKRLGVGNLRCVRIDAYWGMYLLFRDESVESIYMNFPDPWPKKKHGERRLTNLRNMYIYARKLHEGGEIHLRTDEYFLIEYTLENAQYLQAFETHYMKNPKGFFQTKYETKWLNEGKDIHYLKLVKIKQPVDVDVPRLKEVEELPHVRTSRLAIDFEEVVGKPLKIEENLIVKFFKVWKDDEGNMLVETLLVENTYKHYFFLQVKRKEDDFVVSISPFSEVLKTEGIRKLVHYVSGSI